MHFPYSHTILTFVLLCHVERKANICLGRLFVLSVYPAQMANVSAVPVCGLWWQLRLQLLLELTKNSSSFCYCPPDPDFSFSLNVPLLLSWGLRKQKQFQLTWRHLPPRANLLLLVPTNHFGNDFKWNPTVSKRPFPFMYIPKTSSSLHSSSFLFSK